METSIRCPQCGQLDTVQKVRSIVDEQTAYRASSESPKIAVATMYNQNQAILRNKLAIPELNVDNLNSCIRASIVLTAFGVPLFVIGLILSPISSLCIGILWLYGPVSLLIALYLKRRKLQRDKFRRTRAEDIMENSYYCHRDDIVFIPDASSADCIPSSRFQAFLGY